MSATEEGPFPPAWISKLGHKKGRCEDKNAEVSTDSEVGCSRDVGRG